MARFLDVSSLAIATGAGLATALLFASLVGGGALALPLFILTPLPIAIVGLGWGGPAGWLAAASASLAIAFGIGWHAAVALVLSVALPIPLTVRLLGLARVGAGEPLGRIEWYPLGRALAALAGFVALGTVIGGWAIGFEVEATARETSAAAQAMMGPAADPARVDAVVRLTVSMMPLVFPASWLLASAFDLWLAAKIVARSGRLARPPEDLATILIPAPLAVLFVVAIAGTFVGGWVAAISAVIAGVLFALHFLTGLGVLHLAVRGSELKPILLAIAWGSMLLFTVPALVVALAGLLDPVFGFRRRLAARRP